MKAGALVADYATARAAFLNAAEAARASLTSFPHPARGPGDEPLSVDLAWLGAQDAPAVMVIVSGCHGVEGYCGSAAQVAWLSSDEGARLPTNVAALMIHAINPHGFAWTRRVTEDNVDLNRNWFDFEASLPANPGYDSLADALCPAEWSPETQAASRAELRAYAARHGPVALQQAVSGGQYRHPQGVFYGGCSPTWSRRTLTCILQDRLGAAKHVGILDIHTGLGPTGLGERIVGAAPGTKEYARACAWYGGAVTSLRGGDSVSAELRGDWLTHAPSLLPCAEVTGVALEFGTVSGGMVLDALRADAWLHARGDPLSAQGRAIKAQVRAAFCVDTEFWRGMVWGQTRLACRQATTALARATA